MHQNTAVFLWNSSKLWTSYDGMIVSLQHLKWFKSWLNWQTYDKETMHSKQTNTIENSSTLTMLSLCTACACLFGCLSNRVNLNPFQISSWNFMAILLRAKVWKGLKRTTLCCTVRSKLWCEETSLLLDKSLTIPHGYDLLTLTVQCDKWNYN